LKRFSSAFLALLVCISLLPRISDAAPKARFSDLTVDNTVTIPNASISGVKLIDNTVTSAKILDNTISLEKVASSGTRSSSNFLRGDATWSTTTQTGIVSFRNLKITTPADNQSVTITADKIVATDNSDVVRVLSSVSLTVNLDVAGANGLDNGTIAANTGYFLYVIDNGSTTAGLASTSATAPTMPSGYTYKALVGWCTTDATTTPFNIEEFTQLDDLYVWTAPQLVYNATTASDNTFSNSLAAGGALTYATAPPNIVKQFNLRIRANTNVAYYFNPVTFANSMAEDNPTVYYVQMTGGNNQHNGSFSLPAIESQRFYSQVQGPYALKTYVLGFTLKR
jgi:hypothetical protein